MPVPANDNGDLVSLIATLTTTRNTIITPIVTENNNYVYDEGT